MLMKTDNNSISITNHKYSVDLNVLPLSFPDTKYNHKNSRIAEDKPKSSHDDHNTMMNLISNNPRVVHNRSRSRSNANKLNFSNSSNSLSKFTKENNNLNKDKGNTDELNIVSKPTISHSTSVFEVRD